ENTLAVVSNKVEWLSSDESIAMVEAGATGEAYSVRAVAPGDATITAEFQEFSEKIDIHVSDPRLETLKIGTSLSSSPIGGEGVQLTVTGTYDNGWTVNLTNNVEWKSDTVTVANFSPTSRGLLFGLAKGQAHVTATIDGIVATGSHTLAMLLFARYMSVVISRPLCFQDVPIAQMSFVLTARRISDVLLMKVNSGGMQHTLTNRI